MLFGTIAKNLNRAIKQRARSESLRLSQTIPRQCGLTRARCYLKAAPSANMPRCHVLFRYICLNQPCGRIMAAPSGEPEIGRLQPRVVRQRRRRPLQRHRAMLDHIGPVRDRERLDDILLDQQDRQPVGIQT